MPSRNGKNPNSHHSGVVRLARNFDAHGTPCCVLDYTIQELGNSLDHYLVNWCRCDAAICPHAAAKRALRAPAGGGRRCQPVYRRTAGRWLVRLLTQPVRLCDTPSAGHHMRPRNFRPKWACRRIPGSHHRAVRIGVWHFGLTPAHTAKTRALNSPAPRPDRCLCSVKRGPVRAKLVNQGLVEQRKALHDQ
jgi:hypothetical protein